MHRRACLRRINRLCPLGDKASRRQFAQRVVVDLAAFARLLGRRRGTGGSLDAEAICDTAKQGAELQPAHEAQQSFGLRLAHQSFGKRHVERHVRIEDHQRARQPRLVGISNETLSPLRLRDL